jgi:IS30 family transposase
VSFSEDVERFGDQLVRLVDAGVAVKEAAGSLGIVRQRAYAILRAVGRPAGRPRCRGVVPDRVLIGSVFDATGSISRAARSAGVSHSVARRVLVEAGLLDTAKAAHGKPDARRRFLELVESGSSAAQAAREVGVNERTGRDWRKGIRKVGDTRVHSDGRIMDYRTGTRYTQPVRMTSTAEPAAIDARYLSPADRIAIADGLLSGATITRIAAGIGKHKSTVSREVRVHRVEGRYLPYQAHHAAAAARARPKEAKLVRNEALRTEVEKGLQLRFSPEQISHRLRRDFPDDESMRVSHETIYQALYFQARGGLKREVQQSLRSGRVWRKPQRKPDQRNPRFHDDMIMISERPAEAEDRAVPGHWEGDLIMGAGNQTAIGTLVERSTRYTMLVHLPGGHDAETVRDGLIATISTLPEHLRGSLTWDQGCEMARHKQFTMATDMQVYFCDPHSPWQHGSNENTNGLLRQYFPKGTDLSVHSPENLEHVAQQLNARPRKTLGWDTPAERLRDPLTT